MIISTVQVYNDLGFTQGWFSSKFRHLAFDYLKDGCNQYDAVSIINYAKQYKAESKNYKQNVKSMAMMKQLIEYLERLNNGSSN